MAAHLAHNQETRFESYDCNHLDAHSNYSFRINLAQRVERKCFKLKVVGSNPTIYSFASSYPFFEPNFGLKILILP